MYAQYNISKIHKQYVNHKTNIIIHHKIIKLFFYTQTQIYEKRKSLSKQNRLTYLEEKAVWHQLCQTLFLLADCGPKG